MYTQTIYVHSIATGTHNIAAMVLPSTRSITKRTQSQIQLNTQSPLLLLQSIPVTSSPYNVHSRPRASTPNPVRSRQGLNQANHAERGGAGSKVSARSVPPRCPCGNWLIIHMVVLPLGLARRGPGSRDGCGCLFRGWTPFSESFREGGSPSAYGLWHIGLWVVVWVRSGLGSGHMILLRITSSMDWFQFDPCSLTG